MNNLSNNTKKIYTVTEISFALKHLLKEVFAGIYVRGELSNVKVTTQGHCFFSLKDENAVLNCVMFQRAFKDIKFKLEDGLKVVVYGNLSVFEKRGSYNLVVEEIIPEGKGALQLAFEQLKKKLQEEGLFDEKYKKKIPEYPQKIGIITSPTGAAIRDILNVISRRFATVHILIYPAIVQGEDAAPTIIKGIEIFNKFFPVDVIIIARGGGSIEDLWPFNEESVARAVFKSKIPIISAIGHQIDFTITDFVADLRAPTPSAAAEIVTKKKEDVETFVKESYRKLQNSIINILNDYQINFDFLMEKFKNITVQLINNKKNRIESSFQKFIYFIKSSINNEKNRYKTAVAKLNLLNPFAILSRGYSITYKLPENQIIKQSKDVNINDKVKIKLFNGEIFCNVTEIST